MFLGISASNIVIIRFESTSPNMVPENQGKQPFIGYIKDADYYFDGYSHFSIHEEMLKDTVRTKTYMNSIIKNPQLFQGKIVLDVGSGTGILSIFAARAGAKHVYGIEKANIYLHSRKIIQQNGLSDKITIINGLVEEIELPVEKVDIIISEWMGYFLLYESMFDSVLFARDKWLAPDGILMPNKATMFIAALDDEDYYKKKLGYWDDVYGVSMKCIKKWILSQPLVDPIDHHDILSSTDKFYEIDLQKAKKQDLDFMCNFNMDVTISGKVYGFVTWFDCEFTHGKKKYTLSTSPFRKSTHWKQTIFYVESPFKVEENTDKIFGSIKVEKADDNIRELNVIMEFQKKSAIEDMEEGQSKWKQYYRIS